MWEKLGSEFEVLHSSAGRLNDDPKPSKLRSDATRRAFGFIFGPTSIKPVHVANVLFWHTTGSYANLEVLEQFVKNKKLSDDELEFDSEDWFNGGPRDEEIKEVGRFMRLLLDNDDGLYVGNSNAPTGTSTRLTGYAQGNIRVGRFVYQLLSTADSEYNGQTISGLRHELENYTDPMSVLFRPIVGDVDHESSSTDWSEPLMDNPLEDEKAGSDLAKGFATLSQHFNSPRQEITHYPGDLIRAVKFGCFALIVHIANRNEELQLEYDAPMHERTGERGRFPILLNYTADQDRQNRILQTSFDCFQQLKQEAQQATTIGARAQLAEMEYETDGDSKSLTDYNKSELITLIQNHDFPDDRNVSEGSTEARDYQLFASQFRSAADSSVLDGLTDAYSWALNQNTFAGNEVYPVQNGIRNLARRMGLIKPHGNYAKHRWFRPDPSLLETLILSVVDPEDDFPRIPLTDVCERLKTRYGILVGGTDGERQHLSDWGISIGSNVSERGSLDYNYKQFRTELVELGLARAYADGVTFVYPNQTEANQ